MRIKHIVIALIAVLFLGMTFLSFRSGINLQGAKNPVSDFSSIADLQKSVSFSFLVPTVISEEENLEMHNYSGSMVEIKAVESGIIFRAAPFISNDADVSGDYREYETDNIYHNEIGEITRFREDTEYGTIVNITTNSIAYSISFDKAISEDEAYRILGIEKNNLIPGNVTEEESNQTENISKDNTGNTENTESNTSDDVTFSIFENSESNMKFMLPNVESKITDVYSNNTLTLLLQDKLLFAIEYYPNGYDTSSFVNQELITLDDTHILRYIVNNDFEESTQEYNDYEAMMQNIETIADTFNVNNN